MDSIEILIGLGLVFTGVIIGYPLGHIFGKRDAMRRDGRHERQPKKPDILLAEVIE